MKKKPDFPSGYIPPKVKNPFYFNYDEILNPLLYSDMVQVNGEQSKPYSNYSNNFITKNTDDIGLAERQIAMFLANTISRTKFNKLNIRDIRRNKKDNNSMPTYDPITRDIKINTQDKDNPLTQFIHEGTHALSDLYLDPQKYTIKPLAKLETKTNRNLMNDLDWYEQAQDIINVNGFKNPDKENVNAQPYLRNSYSYEGYAKPILEEDLEILNNLMKEKFNTKNLVEDFRGVLEYLNKTNYEDSVFVDPFDEFIAFSTDNIHNPWNIDQRNWKDKNDGRALVQGITKGMYNKFHEIDPNFSSNYPDANKAYLNRITQVRDYDKHPDAKTYRKNYKLKHTSNPYTQGYSNVYNQNINPIIQQLAPMQQQNLTTLANQSNNQYGDTWSQTAVDHYNQQLNLQNTSGVRGDHSVEGASQYIREPYLGLQDSEY